LSSPEVLKLNAFLYRILVKPNPTVAVRWDDNVLFVVIYNHLLSIT